MRFALKLGAFCLLSMGALAQFTTVTGTVTDPNALPYAGGTISATLVSSGTPTLSGLAYSPPQQPTGLNSAGAFTMRLADVTVLSPGGSTWSFTVCSGVGTVQPSFGKASRCFTVTGVSISGASQDISTTLNASALALTVPFGAGAGCGSGTANTFMMFTGTTTCGNAPMSFDGVNTVTVSKIFTIGVGGAAFNVNGSLASYNGLASFGNGLAQVQGIQQGSSFTGNMTATQIGNNVPASGHQFYRVNCYLVISATTAASSTLPQCQVSFTDNNTSVVETATFAPTNTGNAVGTFTQGTFFFNPKPGTAINVSTTGYVSTGGTMTYINGFNLECL